MKTLVACVTFSALAFASNATEPSSNRLALARQLTEFSQEDVFREFATCVSNDHARAMPFLEVIQDEAKVLIPVMKQKIAELFAQEFTESELRVLIKFTQHPTFKRFKAIQPEIEEKYEEAMREYIEEHPEIQKRMVERMMKQQREAQPNAGGYSPKAADGPRRNPQR